MLAIDRVGQAFSSLPTAFHCAVSRTTSEECVRGYVRCRAAGAWIIASPAFSAEFRNSPKRASRAAHFPALSLSFPQQVRL